MMIVILVPKLSNPCIFDFLTRVASSRPLRGSVMILGHCGLARHCVWSSGAAHTAPGGRRRRLLELKIKDFHRFPLVFIDFHWFSSISIGFHWFPLIFDNIYILCWSNRRRRRPAGTAWAAADGQTHVLTCPQCPRMTLAARSRPGDVWGIPRWPTGSRTKKHTQIYY